MENVKNNGAWTVEETARFIQFGNEKLAQGLNSFFYEGEWYTVTREQEGA